MVLQQSEKGGELLEMANIHLEAAGDIEKAIASNHQLDCPSNMPVGESSFLRICEKNSTDLCLGNSPNSVCVKMLSNS